MKKMKKLLTGLLALVMTITTVAIQSPITAKADSENPVTTDGTINVNLKGSLTIHKYEKDEAGNSGTGEIITDTSNLGTVLQGAGFTLYKVVDYDDMQEYYSTNPTDLPDVYDYVDETTGTIKNAYADKIVHFDADGSVSETGTITEIKTDANGIATFSDLDLGFYVVIETTKPDTVPTATNPFLVAIPMTKADGSSWLYDVNVYPKNKAITAGIDLVKKDKNTDEVLSGFKFKLEKQVGTGWIEITKEVGAAGDNQGAALNLVTNGQGKIQVQNLSYGTYRFTEIGRSGADDQSNPTTPGYIIDKKTTYTFIVNTNGTVTDENGQSFTDSTITVYNEKPDLTKEVQDRTNTTNWNQDSDYNIGDKITYRITINVPTNIIQLKTFTVTDTPTHLKDDISQYFTVKYGANKDAALADSAESVNTDAYTVTQGEGENGFTITFAPAQMSKYAEKTIVITYKAELLEGAVITTEGNPNTATLEYSNTILPDDSTEIPDTDKIEDNAIVYTFMLKIKKTAADTDKGLVGVIFDLYKEVDEDTDSAIPSNDAPSGLPEDKYWLKVATLTTENGGIASKTGLANGIYYLVETKTNDGYNLLSAPKEVQLSIQYTTTMTTNWTWTTDSNTGEKTLIKHEITSTTFANGTTDETVNDGYDGFQKINIINKKGFTLPSTGGVGTYIFVFVGVSMMAAAVILFFTTKKKEAQKN